MSILLISIYLDAILLISIYLDAILIISIYSDAYTSNIYVLRCLYF